jgi:glycine cleavage system H lipoate-binding protein
MKPHERKQHCVWMEAGVIDYKICDNSYDCTTCSFDRAMQQTASANLARRRAGQTPPGKKGQIIPWQEKLRQRSGLQQQCRHMLTKRVPAYFCGNHYNCQRCPFDQLLEDQWQVFAPPPRPRLQEVFGIAVPFDRYLHQGHTWTAVEDGGRVRLGMDAFTQKVFGPAETWRLPRVGEMVQQNYACLELARSSQPAPVLAPVTGVVEAVNPAVRRHPQVVHDYPYEDGWLLVVTPTQLKSNLEQLLYGDKNLAWINYETNRLLGLLPTPAGLTLPDGGALIDDVYGHFPDLPWDLLVHEFLRSR